MKEMPKKTRSELFIVDNSEENWSALDYLKEWCDDASSIDIATGYFEIGALLALDGEWQKLKKIRILMGDETTKRTKSLIFQAHKEIMDQKLDDSLNGERKNSPFLTGTDAIEKAIKSGQIEVRIFDKKKFHAKTYITHHKKAIIGSQALVGSSNFTRPGLQKNIELNIKVESSSEVQHLQDWFDDYWKLGHDVNDSVLHIISKHTELLKPFDIYAKALHEYFKGYSISDTEWELSDSIMYELLDRYQKEAYGNLLKIADRFNGAFLCDGVGLGKTFVGLMLIERLVLREGKKVVVFAPKGVKDSVWIPEIKKRLPNIGGVEGTEDFSSLSVFSHTDLSTRNYERFQRISELADVFIIDEAHHFRNVGKKGNPDTWGDSRSRYWRMSDILNSENRSAELPPKKVYFLTATPVNNALTDFRHMIELFTRRDEQYFKDIGINYLTANFNAIQANFEKKIGRSFSSDDDASMLCDEEIFQQLVVQRSRKYVKESQKQESGRNLIFPDRKKPIIATYSMRSTYGHLIDLFTKAFSKKNPLLNLAIYSELSFYIGDDPEILEKKEKKRHRQILGLIRTLFLKRFDSSIKAFEMTSDHLIKKMLIFLEKHSQSANHQRKLKAWKEKHQDILNYTMQQQAELFWEENNDQSQIDYEDYLPEELFDDIEELSHQDYDLEEMIKLTYEDLDQLIAFVSETRSITASKDDKLKKLKRLLKSKELKGKKVIVFSEYKDTARYIFNELVESEFEHVEELDSSSAKDRRKVIQRFSPYYNDSSSAEVRNEIQILITTDVLSEGLNLQDATYLINYEIHWNPVRLMQRIGRVDRRLDNNIERQIIKDHPHLKEERGIVKYWNFLPSKELKTILSLYEKVTEKTLLISETFGIEGGQLLTPEDDLKALQELNAKYEGEQSIQEETHLEYQKLLDDNPDLENRLNRLPNNVYSGRKRPKKAVSGVFFCYALPALDKERSNEDEDLWTEESGKTEWYFYRLDTKHIAQGLNDIKGQIKSKPNTQRKLNINEQDLIEIRKQLEKHIKNTYLKNINAPAGIKPTLKCWMELNEG